MKALVKIYDSIKAALVNIIQSISCWIKNFFYKLKCKLGQFVRSKEIIYPMGFIVTLVLYLFLYFCSFGFIPDFIDLSNNHNVSTYLATILSSLASLTGLLIAILIIALEYYKRNLTKNIYLKNLIKNKWLSILVNSYVFVFLFSGITLLILSGNSPKNQNVLTLCYTSILAFIILIPATFFLSYKLIQSLSINEIIDGYIEDLSFDSIFLIHINNKTIFSQKNQNISNSEIDTDTLEIINKLIINELAIGSKAKAQQTLNKTTNKFRDFILMKSAAEIENTKYHQFRFSTFLLSLIKKTKKNLDNNLVLICCLARVKEFYAHYNQKKLQIYFVTTLFESFYSDLLQIYSEENRLKETILKSLEEIILNTLETNLPPEESVNYLLNKDDTDFISREINSIYRLSWEKLRENYTKYFIEEMNLAITNKDETYFLKVLSIYVDCIFNPFWRLNNKDMYLKSDWIIMNFINLVYCYETAIEREVLFKIDASDLIDSHSLIEFFRKNEEWAINLLIHYLGFVIWLNNGNKLTYSIFCGINKIGNIGKTYSENSLTSLAVNFVNNYHNSKLFEKCFNNVFSVLETIFQDYNNNIKSDDVNVGLFDDILNEIKESYLINRKNKSKSQQLLDKINKFKKEIKTVANR